MEIITEEESPQRSQLPEFDASFRDTLPTFYFHHIIDPTAATLRVEVLGPNLAYTFRHERAKELRLAASSIYTRLEQKVTGFLALQTGKGQKRIVLAWAQSGHGVGLKGDLLDPEPSVLPNEVWTKRAIVMGRALALQMSRPFDGRVFQTTGVKMEGVFLASHVEVKLAVHAISILLSRFGITQDLDNVSLEHLKALRQATWNDGSKPAFEIYFSRKNCHFCGKFVRKLQSATGIRLRLIWRDRLVKKVYETKSLPNTNFANRPQPQEAIRIGTADAETIMTDEVHVIDTVDLSGDLPPVAEIINLTGDGIGNSNNFDSAPSEQEQHRRAAADAYIEGLAYCVGQIDECPAGAQDAILRLATQKHNAMNLANINKPLPATPQMAPPGYFAAATAEPDDAEALRTAENAIINPLLTPPSSGSSRENRANDDGPRASLDRNRTRSFHSQALQIGETTPTQPPRKRRALRKDSRETRIPTLAAAGHRRTRRVSLCIELLSRRCSDSPDPF